MKMLNLEHARGSLGRGLARQALEAAEADCADAAGIVHSLHDLAPNPRNRARHARRLMRRRGVLRASATRGGVAVVFRNTLDVIVRKDGTDCYREPRIAWTSVRARAGKHMISFVTWQVQVGLHAMQRHVERSACQLANLLPQMDGAMTDALDWLGRAIMETSSSTSQISPATGVSTSTSRPIVCSTDSVPTRRASARRCGRFAICWRRQVFPRIGMLPLWHGARLTDLAARLPW